MFGLVINFQLLRIFGDTDSEKVFRTSGLKGGGGGGGKHDAKPPYFLQAWVDSLSAVVFPNSLFALQVKHEPSYFGDETESKHFEFEKTNFSFVVIHVRSPLISIVSF
jgi:hypothetical protein